MQTQQGRYAAFLGRENARFTIPFYQRNYAWQSEQCINLWNDIMRAGRTGMPHYMSLVLLSDVKSVEDGIASYDIIDGQQRITTTIILLTAFADFLGTRDGVVACEYDEADVDAEAIAMRFLRAGTASKITLSHFDQATLEAVMGGANLPAHPSERITSNYRLFRDAMDEEGFDADMLWRGFNMLEIIHSTLDEEDDAQAIFESLNTKGIPLTAADLSRNYLLVGLPREEQDRLYNEYWDPIEMMFADDISSTGSLKLNTGLRMWLSIQTRDMHIRDRSQTYNYFKTYMENHPETTSEEMLEELRVFCLLWAENYELHPGRSHCSSMEWGATRRPHAKLLRED